MQSIVFRKNQVPSNKVIAYYAQLAPTWLWSLEMDQPLGYELCLPKTTPLDKVHTVQLKLVMEPLGNAQVID